MYKPRSTKDIYIKSLSVNSASLEKQLAEQSVPAGEIKRFVDTVSKMYRENIDRIVEECDKDMMALERVPSPLKLLVDCLAKVQKSMSLSPQARALVQRYASAWEDWM
jgi:hypothetical protein